MDLQDPPSRSASFLRTLNYIYIYLFIGYQHNFHVSSPLYLWLWTIKKPFGLKCSIFPCPEIIFPSRHQAFAKWNRTCDCEGDDFFLPWLRMRTPLGGTPGCRWSPWWLELKGWLGELRQFMHCFREFSSWGLMEFLLSLSLAIVKPGFLGYVIQILWIVMKTNWVSKISPFPSDCVCFVFSKFFWVFWDIWIIWLKVEIWQGDPGQSVKQFWRGAVADAQSGPISTWLRQPIYQDASCHTCHPPFSD